MNKIPIVLMVILILSACSIDDITIDTLTPPIILITKTDSLVEAKDANGKIYVLNGLDRVDYRVAFLKVGDTLKKTY